MATGQHFDDIARHRKRIDQRDIQKASTAAERLSTNHQLPEQVLL
jgi:hypothetical protein